MKLTSFPKTSFIIPTLNEGKRLDNCLSHIANQDYPKEKIEIIIADADSIDDTLEIANKYNCKIVNNLFKTAESGKAVAIRNASGDYLIFIDADNLIIESNWLEKMITPLEEDGEILGSEPISFTLRTEDGIIDRYCALMGMNDPLCYWLGSYDRTNVLSGTWTGLDIKTTIKENYLELILERGNIPTIGANGTVIRSKILKDNSHFFDDYYFDMDLLEQIAAKYGTFKFAKVDIGIVHLYCGSSFKKFNKKQLRRVKDFLFRKNLWQVFIKDDHKTRTYNYAQKSNFQLSKAILLFILSCITIIPLIIQTVKGYIKKPESAWFIHPIMCWITLIMYIRGAIESIINNQEFDRAKW